jgi:tRNA (guanine-N7-)-methyltransferase
MRKNLGQAPLDLMLHMPETLKIAPHKRHRRHANPFTVRHDMTHITLGSLFDRDAPVALDVGCGPGRFVAELALAHPEWNVLGLEIRPHLVVATEQALQEAGVSNGRGLLANANLHLPSLLPAGSVQFLSVNFPDPWYKKRHHKRRVVQLDWLEALRPALKVGAEVHAMSDYLPVAEHMREAFALMAGLQNLYPGESWPTESTTGLTTEREQTHMGRGEPIYRMAYRFVG